MDIRIALINPLPSRSAWIFALLVGLTSFGCGVTKERPDTSSPSGRILEPAPTNPTSSTLKENDRYPDDERTGASNLSGLEMLERIDPIPVVEYFIRNDRYAEADEYLAFFLDYEYVSTDPRAQELKQSIDATRSDWARKLRKINEGLLNGESDEIEGQAVAIASDFLVVGDLRDIAKEAGRYVNTGEFDTVKSTLAVIGVALAGATIPFPGLAPAKGGVSFFKYMHRTVGLPPWLRSVLVSNLSHPIRLKDFFADVFHTYRAAGVRSTMKLIGEAKSIEDFRVLASMGKQFGPRTATLIKITDSAAVEAFRRQGGVPREMLLEAGTYGKAGIDQLEKLGPEKFAQTFRRRLTNVELGFTRSGKEAVVAGKTVVYRNQLFSPSSVDELGRTNLERMRTGIAPLGKDGMSIELHHLKQRNGGIIIEMTRTEHRREWSPLFHRYSHQSEINRPGFDGWRSREYWKWRAGSLGS